ncbi:MAG: response regulator [Myxococcaceae bacterium]|nr:response regulator [Myxococcaceae bacterium]
MEASTTLPSTVLLVDDEVVVIELLSKVLQRENLPYVAVTRGKEAIALLERQPFGALVTDKNLPDVNGLEVLRAARRLQPFCACIMITGYSTQESVLEVLRMGANDYIEKPFPDLKLLVQRIRSAMDHRRAEFERNTLVDALQAMKASLKASNAEAFREKTQREVLETVLELRVEEATRDLRRRLEEAESARRCDREIARGVQHNLDALLEYVRGAGLGDDAPASMVRGVLREIERRVEEAVALLRDPED